MVMSDKKNSYKKWVVVYLFIMFVLCSIFLCLDIYKNNISNIILSDQQKYIHLFEKNHFIRNTMDYIEYIIILIYIIFPIIFSKKNNKYLKILFVINVSYVLGIIIIEAIVVHIFNIKHVNFLDLLIHFSLATFFVLIVSIIKYFKKNTCKKSGL